MRIALAGNPNSGKTSMYNILTGSNEHVGNWAGVTVDKKEGILEKKFAQGRKDVQVVDLPGAYSMSPFTSDESVTSTYIKNEKPDVIINIVDATNLSRSLFFTTQLLELGVPVVVALNKSDINLKKDIQIDEQALSHKLGCPVLKTVSVSAGDNGLAEVVQVALDSLGKEQTAPYAQPHTDMSDREAVEAGDRQRFRFVNSVVKEVEQRKTLSAQRNIQDRIDVVITHPAAGIAIFAIVMWLVFYISQTTVGAWIADWLVGYIDVFKEWVAVKVAEANPFLQSLLLDGIIGGVGAVVGFLPLVMVMYFLIALLEDCGYMARATVVLDPIFKKVGLSGKSVIPMVIGIGCAIPGVMASRTIRDERERRATAMLAPFMPCGAKLPVISLFAGAFFGGSGWITYAMYMAGILLILAGGLLVKKLTGYKYKRTFFIIELPQYKIPGPGRAFQSMLSRGKAYIIKAGTIILVCNAAVQIMQYFNWRFQPVQQGMESTSILATIASPIAVILVPIVGVAAWQLAAAVITGFIAKENVVGTLAVCYGLTAFIDTEELALVGGAGDVAVAMGLTKAAALAYLMFNLFSPPCFAAIGAMNAELQNAKWFWGGIALQLGTGYAVAFAVYQLGTLLATGHLGAGFMPGLLVVAAMAVILIGMIRKAEREEARMKPIQNSMA